MYLNPSKNLLLVKNLVLTMLLNGNKASPKYLNKSNLAVQGPWSHSSLFSGFDWVKQWLSSTTSSLSWLMQFTSRFSHPIVSNNTQNCVISCLEIASINENMQVRKSNRIMNDTETFELVNIRLVSTMTTTTATKVGLWKRYCDMKI